MWGEDWGAMIWGGGVPTQVPVMPWALLILGFLLGICALKAKSSAVARVFPVLVVLVVPVLVMVASAVPNTFENATVADADQVNQNFQALEEAIPNIAFTGQFSTSRHNAGGTSTTNIGSISRRMCFLTSVSFEDTDSNGEWAECEIIASGGTWFLRARLGSTSDADAWCEARCLTW